MLIVYVFFSKLPYIETETEVDLICKVTTELCVEPFGHILIKFACTSNICAQSYPCICMMTSHCTECFFFIKLPYI